MEPLLDAVPFPFHRPDAQELLSKLTTLYPSKQAAFSMAEDAGLDTSQLFFDQAITFVWREILRRQPLTAYCEHWYRGFSIGLRQPTPPVHFL